MSEAERSRYTVNLEAVTRLSDRAVDAAVDEAVAILVAKLQEDDPGASVVIRRRLERTWVGS